MKQDCCPFLDLFDLLVVEKNLFTSVSHFTTRVLNSLSIRLCPLVSNGFVFRWSSFGGTRGHDPYLWTWRNYSTTSESYLFGPSIFRPHPLSVPLQEWKTLKIEILEVVQECHLQPLLRWVRRSSPSPLYGLVGLQRPRPWSETLSHNWWQTTKRKDTELCLVKTWKWRLETRTRDRTSGSVSPWDGTDSHSRCVLTYRHSTSE